MLTGVPHRQSVDCMSSVSSLVPLAAYQPQQYQTPTPNQNWSVPNCILEMRKEKSRDAARSRRGKENFEFYELAKLLPLPAAITSQLDKASIIRLTISYLKLRDFSHHADLPWVSSLHSPSHTHHDKLHLLKSSPLRPSRSVATEVFEQHQGTHILQSLDGFAFVLAADGRFLYISETVSIYLGLSQVEMTGSSIFDYVHQHDHAEVSEQLGLSAGNAGHSPPPASTANSDDGSCDRPAAATMQAGPNTAYAGLERSFCVRMKSTLTKRGCHFKSSGYRVVLVLCHLRPQSIYTSPAPSLGGVQPKDQPVLGLVGLAVALPPPSVNEVRLGCDMFVTRVNLDFRVSHCEPRVQQLLDYNADDLTGRSLYSLVHAQDVQRLRQLHMDLMHKGQAMSAYYRLMNKSGGFSWIQTCATVICASKQSSQEEQSIICVNYVISATEFDSVVMDASQLPGYREPSPLKRDCISPPVSPLPKPLHTLSASGVGTPGTLAMHQSNTADTLPLSSLPITGVSKLEPVKDASCDPVSSPLTYEVLDDTKTRKKYNGGNGVGKNRKRPAVSDSPEDGGMKEKKEISELSRPWKSGASDNSNVKDLEDAMKKHLPPPPVSQSPLDANSKLVPQPPTIQWIGAPAPTTPPSATSSLLRQLYVNRETVIRQSNQPVAGNGRSPYTPYGDVAPADAYHHHHHHHSHGDFMLHHNPAGLGAPYNGYEAYPQGRDNLVPGMMTPVATLPSMTSMTSMTSMQRHVPYELPLRPQVLVHPSLDYAPPPPIHNEPQLYHHLSGGNPWYPQPN